MENSTSRADEVPISELFADIWRRRWVIVVVSLLGGLSGFVFGTLRERTFESAVLLAPVADDAFGSGGSISSIAGRLGGLASIAGLPLGSGGTADKSIAVLRSDLLLERFIVDEGILPVLFSSDWDASSEAWKGRERTVWEGVQRLKKGVRSISVDRLSGHVTLRVRWTDPLLAARWAQRLVELANEHLRSAALEESGRNIEFLRAEGADAQSVELRQSIYSVLEQEIERQMFAKGRVEYALEVLDPARPSERPVPPGRTMLSILGFFVGGVLLVLFILIRRIVTVTR